MAADFLRDENKTFHLAEAAIWDMLAMYIFPREGRMGDMCWAGKNANLMFGLGKRLLQTVMARY